MSYLKHMPVDIEFAGRDATDDEKVRYALRRERLGQQWFRKQLVAAYDGRCAVSDCGVSEALEAAHIENYSGLNRKLPAMAFCFGATYIPYLMLI